MAKSEAEVVIEGDVTAGELGPVRDALATSLEKGALIKINLAALGSFDVSFFQLLLSAQASAAATGKKLSFPAAPNVSLVKSALDLGIARPEGAGEDWPW